LGSDHSADPWEIAFVFTQANATAVYRLIGINSEIYGWVIIESAVAQMRFKA
jgi:hypothetical protein